MFELEKLVTKDDNVTRIDLVKFADLILSMRTTEPGGPNIHSYLASLGMIPGLVYAAYNHKVYQHIDDENPATKCGQLCFYHQALFENDFDAKDYSLMCGFATLVGLTRIAVCDLSSDDRMLVFTLGITEAIDGEHRIVINRAPHNIFVLDNNSEVHPLFSASPKGYIHAPHQFSYHIKQIDPIASIRRPRCINTTHGNI